jgi:phosphoribosylamine---glycine ligase
VPLRILVIGGGGREHALAWRLAQSPSVEAIVASPGNPGIARLGTCVPPPESIAGYSDIAEAHRIDLTVVGPEAPLVAGIVDEFRKRNQQVIGPTAAAARLEGSKCFAKQFFTRAGIPSARSGNSLDDFGLPVVIKADGLAAGKGVVVAQTRREAEDALARLGPNVVIEEHLEGREVSFIGLCNGMSLTPFPPTQDHKRVLDADHGPNTGGMGAYLDSDILSSQESGQIMDRVMLPALAQMQKERTPFTGFLYAGLMMTAEGPKLLEFNVRLGDPETQAIMHSFQGDLAQFLLEAGNGPVPTLRDPSPSRSVCVVIASQGYPDQPRTGDVVTGIAEAENTGAVVFQAGTKRVGSDLVTNGGRVLGVTAGGDTLQIAITRAYAAVEKIHFDGMHYRRDIGRKGLVDLQPGRGRSSVG